MTRPIDLCMWRRHWHNGSPRFLGAITLLGFLYGCQPTPIGASHNQDKEPRKDVKLLTSSEGDNYLKIESGSTYRVLPFDKFRRLSPDLSSFVLATAVSGPLALDAPLASGTKVAIPVRFLACASFLHAAKSLIENANASKSSHFAEGDPKYQTLPDFILALYRSESFKIGDAEREASKCSDFTDRNASQKWLMGARIFILLLKAEKVEAKDPLSRRMSPSGWLNEFTVEGARYSYSFDVYGRYLAGGVIGDVIPLLGTGDIEDFRYLDAFR